MNFIPKFRLLIATLLLIAGSLPTVSAADDVARIKPHRGVYDLTLKQASERSGIRSIRGRIVYEISGAECSGYTTRFRFKTLIDMGRRQLDNDEQTTVFESGDATRFDFASKYFLNGQMESERRGTATLGEDGLHVELRKPEETEVDLKRAKFMTAHLKAVLRAANAGEQFLTEVVFDGSGNGDEVMETTAIIGEEKSVVEAQKGETDQVAEQLGKEMAWPVSISYFKPSTEDGAGERLPVYQVSFLLYPGGISRDLTLTYEDYSMNAALSTLEYLPKESCSE